MKSGVRFFKPEEFHDRLGLIFDLVRDRIIQSIPYIEVKHIGSSAIKGAISKGDLDILVRVEKDDFEETICKIQALGFEIKQDTFRSDTLCMLVTDEFDEDVAIQLIAKGSKFEDFVRFRDIMNANPALVEEYNRLKLAAEGLPEDVYRARKSDFIESLLNTNEA